MLVQLLNRKQKTQKLNENKGKLFSMIVKAIDVLFFSIQSFFL